MSRVCRRRKHPRRPTASPGGGARASSPARHFSFLCALCLGCSGSSTKVWIGLLPSIPACSLAQSDRRRASFWERTEPRKARAVPELVSSFTGLVRTASRRRNLPDREARSSAPGASHLAPPVSSSRGRRRTVAWRRPAAACRSRGWKAAGDPPTSISTDSTRRRVEC